MGEPSSLMKILNSTNDLQQIQINFNVHNSNSNLLKESFQANVIVIYGISGTAYWKFVYGCHKIFFTESEVCN